MLFRLNLLIILNFAIQSAEISTAKITTTLLLGSNEVTSTLISPCSEKAAMVLSKNLLEIWQTHLGKILFKINFENMYVTSLSWSKNGNYLAICLNNNVIRIYDVVKGNLIDQFDFEKIESISLAPNCNFLVFKTNTAIAILDLKSKKILKILSAMSDSKFQWSCDSLNLAILDDRISIYNTENLNSIFEYSCSNVTRIQWSDSLSKFILLEFNNKEFIVSSMHTKGIENLAKINIAYDEGSLYAVSPDLKKLVTISKTGNVKIYSIDEWQLIDDSGNIVNQSVNLLNEMQLSVSSNIHSLVWANNSEIVVSSNKSILRVKV